MAHISKFAVPAVVLATSGALLAGCGSGSTSTQSTSLLSKVKSTHQLVFAISPFAPQDFQNSKQQWTGYDVNILRGFAKSLGAKLVFDHLSFAASITAVSQKRADVTIDIYETKARAKVLSFSRPMLNYNDAIVVNSQHPAITTDSVSALKGKTIGVVTGSAEVAEAVALEKQTPSDVKYYPNISDCFQALSTGRIDATIQPSTDPAWSKAQNPALHIKILGAVPQSVAPPVQGLRGYYAVPKGQYSASFLKKLNAYLLKIQKNGTEQKILDKYGLTSPVFLQGIASAPNSYTP